MMSDPELEKAISQILKMLVDMHQDITLIKTETANIHRIFYKVNGDEPKKQLSKKQAQIKDLKSRIASEKMNIIKKIAEA